jgi:hypothetical protein
MFNPDTVVSIPICQGCQRPPDMHADDCNRQHELVKQAICLSCAQAVNAAKRGRGEPEIRIDRSAYSFENGGMDDGRDD